MQHGQDTGILIARSTMMLEVFLNLYENNEFLNGYIYTALSSIELDCMLENLDKFFGFT